MSLLLSSCRIHLLVPCEFSSV
ncbi:hypothetical protein RDABS01_035248 [Bienertia sinuspersici]